MNVHSKSRRGSVAVAACTVAIACSGTVAPDRGSGTPDHATGDAGRQHGSGGHSGSGSGGAPATGGMSASGPGSGGRGGAATGGTGGATAPEIYDAGPIPSYCPPHDVPPSASLTPGLGDIPNQLSVKFVLGTHLHLVSQELAIEESTAASDSQFLRCTGLTLAGAKAALEPINRLIDADPSGSISPLFVSTVDGGVTQYFLLNVSAARAPELLSILRESPLVSVAYYSPSPAIPP